MIIWGSRGVTSSVAKGEFHCPNCAQRRSYDHKRVRRFFTLYFIPLFPIGDRGQYVECQTCKGTYREEVLRYDPRAAEEALRMGFDVALQSALVAMMLSDGPAQEAERRALPEIYRSQGGTLLSEQQIQALISTATAGPQPVERVLAPLAKQLSTDAKERLLTAAVRIAMADGALQPQELDTLGAMAQALGVSSMHLKGILTQNAAPTA